MAIFIDVYLYDSETARRTVFHDDTDYDDADNVLFCWFDECGVCDSFNELYFNETTGLPQRLPRSCRNGRYQVEKIVERVTGMVIYNAD